METKAGPVSRRNFIRDLLAAGAGFSILPSALTYARRWVRSGTGAIWVIKWDPIDLPDHGRGLNAWECVMVPPNTFVLHSKEYRLEIDLKTIENFSL